MKKPCLRCLLLESGEKELLKSLEELKTAIPESERADSSLYEKRLSICTECSELSNGMCGKCGGYVEFRALKKRQYCPHEEKKW